MLYSSIILEYVYRIDIIQKNPEYIII